MGILDRFTSKKEQDVKTAPNKRTTAPAAAAEEKKPAKAAAKKAPAKKAAAKDKETKAAPAAAKAGHLSADLLHILVKPLVTEKAAVMASHGQYSFRVAMDANRVQVKQAVKALYGVLPVSVNIQRVRGKFVRFGGRGGMRQTWKKAIVTMPKGSSIDVYAGV